MAFAKGKKDAVSTDRYGRALAANAFFAALGRILGVATAFATTALITRALGAELFGEYALVMALVTVFYVLADFGLGQLFLRELSLRAGAAPGIASEIFTLRLALAVFFLALAPVGALLFSYPGLIVAGAALSAVGFLALSLSHLLTGVFQRALAMHWTAAAEWLGRLVQFVSAGAIFYFAGAAQILSPSAAFFLFIAAFVAGAVVQLAVLFIRSRRFVALGLAFSRSRARALLKEALPLGASLLFVYIYFRTDTIILSLYHPGSPVGFYSLAYRVLENLIFFPAALAGLVFGRLSETWVKRPREFRTLFTRTLGVLALAAPAAALGTFWAAPFITRLLGGPGFEPAAEALKILSAAIFFIFLAALPGLAVVAMGEQRRALWVYAVGAGLNVGLNLIFIPGYSFVAAAWTTVATEAMVTVGLCWIAFRTMSSKSHMIEAKQAAKYDANLREGHFVTESNQDQEPKIKER